MGSDELTVVKALYSALFCVMHPHICEWSSDPSYSPTPFILREFYNPCRLPPTLSPTCPCRTAILRYSSKVIFCGWDSGKFKVFFAMPQYWALEIKSKNRYIRSLFCEIGLPESNNNSLVLLALWVHCKNYWFGSREPYAAKRNFRVVR